MSKNRRQFLKNTTLTALSLGLLSNKTEAKSPKIAAEQALSACDKTTTDFFGEGPFYTENPPLLPNNQLASADEEGMRMIISGRVYNMDCQQYIPNTIIDAWQANNAGEYDNEGFNLRGQVMTNSQGFYLFETIKPGKYGGGNVFRPAHIHFKITPPGFETLTTQLYFEGDPDLDSDTASSIRSGEFDATNRIIPLTMNEDGKLEGTWDIVINGSGVATGMNDAHLDKGMIYQLNSNPFSDRLVIQYGIFRQAKVSLLVYDMRGNMVANLEERILPAEKYEAIWEPDDSIPNGHYFIALKINDLQVHYLKAVRLQ